MPDVILTFDLVRVVGQNVLCMEQDGSRHWFDIRKYDVTVNGKKVVVSVDEAVWNARVEKYADNKTVCLKPMRKCIQCREMKPLVKNQYICSTCKDARKFKNGPHLGI